MESRKKKVVTSHHFKPQLFIILILLISFAAFVGVLFTPALPEITRHFGISTTQAQWTMSIFLIGCAFGQLPYGPLANRFGRKKALYIGIATALVGSILAYISTAFWLLCVSRFIQALGAGGGLKISFTMIADRYEGKEAARAVSLLSYAFGFMPGIATAIGGFITTEFGWRGCFLFLSIYTVFLALLCTMLPETAKHLDSDAVRIKKIAHGLWRQFKNPFLFSYAFLTGLTTSCIYIFATVAPYLAIQGIGIDPERYGFWTLIPSMGLLCGAYIARRIAHMWDPFRNMLTGILLLLIGAIVFTVCFVYGVVNPWSLFFSMFCVNIGVNVLWSSASAKGLSDASDKSNASAVLQFINMGTGMAGLFLIGIFNPLKTMLLPVTFIIIVILAFIVWSVLKAKQNNV